MILPRVVFVIDTKFHLMANKEQISQIPYLYWNYNNITHIDGTYYNIEERRNVQIKNIPINEIIIKEVFGSAEEIIIHFKHPSYNFTFYYFINAMEIFYQIIYNFYNERTQSNS